MLIIVGSPWQALLAKSYILKENILNAQYVIEKSSEKSYAEIIKILDVDESAIRIIIEWQKLTVLSVAKATIASAYIDGIISSLKLRYFKDVRTILVFSEQTVFFKIFYDLFGNEKTYLKSEDGILDYLPKLKEHSTWKKVAGYLFIGSKIKYYVYKSYFPQFQNVIMFRRLKEVTPDRYIPLSTIKSEFLSVLKKSYPLSESGQSFRDRDVLLLCQSLSEDKVMPLEEEMKLYQNFIERCNRQHLSVIIKPHPRSFPEKIEGLKALCSERVEFFDDYGIPAESMLLNGNFKEVVGVYSNTIIYANEFFGVKGISLLKPEVIDVLKKKEKKRFDYIYDRLKEYFSEEYTII